MLRTLDASAGERTNVLTLLHGVPCLQPLDMASLGLLATAVQTVRVPIGTDVVRQGDPGDGFYVVKAGSADVLVDGYAVGRVEQAGSFGERALLRDAPRTATVRSTEPMELLTLSREDFLSGLTGQPIAGLTMLDGGTPPDGTALSDRDRAEVLGRLNLFSHLDSAELRALGAKTTLERWLEGATIISQGDQGDAFYVLLEGLAKVSIDGREVGEVHPGDQLGEIALLHGVPRTATVVASRPVTALALRREDFATALRARVLLG